MKLIARVSLWLFLWPVLLPVWLWRRGKIGRIVAGIGTALFLCLAVGSLVAPRQVREPAAPGQVASVLTGVTGPTAPPARPAATKTTRPSNTSKPSRTPLPTRTPKPSNTPSVTSTRLPTSTPRPANTVAAAALPGVVAAELVGVTDGDTITVQVAGQTETVRYIGIDTPERGQPGYAVATAANRAVLGSGLVYLMADQSARDPYGRLLRYVYAADGTFVNAALVAQGWAQPVAYLPDMRWAAEFRQFAVEAAARRQGFWAGSSAADAAMSYGVNNPRLKPAGFSLTHLR